MTPKYLLSDISMGEEEAQAVADVVRSKWLSMGPKTAEFEQAFAQSLGAKHAVAVSSCTSALHLALAALDIGPGDEVLLPSYTFVATANAVLYQGATPVFVDIVGEDDLNVDVQDLEAQIGPRTKALIVVHMAGFPAPMDEIMPVAERHGLAVVEDACHAIGATYHGSDDSAYRGRKAGTIGNAGCFSFFANKNLVTGEGGMLATDDHAIAQRIRLARSHGMTKTSWDKASGRAADYDVVQLGYNYRCTELTAALGLVQLAKLETTTAQRARRVSDYRSRIEDLLGIGVPFANRHQDSAHHIFPLVLKDVDARDPLRRFLQSRGIQTSVHYPPVHQFTHYRQHLPQQRPLVKTEDVATREITLPLHPLLTKEDVHCICDVVEEGVLATV